MRLLVRFPFSRHVGFCSSLIFRLRRNVVSIIPLFFVTGEEETSHVPTADRVFHIFHTDIPDPKSMRGEAEADEGGQEGEEGLEEINFEDMAKFQEKVEAQALAVSATTTTTLVARTASTAISPFIVDEDPTGEGSVAMTEEETKANEEEETMSLERLSVREVEVEVEVPIGEEAEVHADVEM